MNTRKNLLICLIVCAMLAGCSANANRGFTSKASPPQDMMQPPAAESLLDRALRELQWPQEAQPQGVRGKTLGSPQDRSLI